MPRTMTERERLALQLDRLRTSGFDPKLAPPPAGFDPPKFAPPAVCGDRGPPRACSCGAVGKLAQREDGTLACLECGE